MDIHTSTSTEITSKRSWRDGPVFKTLEALRPWIQWTIIIVMGVFVFYQSQRDTNAQNAVSVSDLQREQVAIRKEMDQRAAARDRQINGMETKMLTREVYEAYHKGDVDRMDRMEKMIEQLLERQSRQP